MIDRDDPDSTVTDPLESCTAVRCTLRDAIIEANLEPGADTITFAFTDLDPHDQFATVTLDAGKGPLVIQESLTITGSQVAGVQISGNNATRIFEFSVAGNYVLEGLTLSHGNGDGTDPSIDGSGGAINSAQPGTTLTIRDSLIRKNSGEFGGAIGFYAGTLNISDTAIINNEAVEVGGAMVVAGDISLTNVTVSGNRVTAPAEEEPEAGGISVQTVFNQQGSAAPSNIVIKQSTIANNSAPTAANLLLGAQNANVTVTLQNTIIAVPQGGGENVDMFATGLPMFPPPVVITSLGNNIVDDDTVTLTEASDFPNTDAHLAPLSENDCPVCPILSGHDLLHGSPAIDGGASIGITTDQRGVARPQGTAVDIGAFEMEFDFGDAKAGFPTRLIVNANGEVTEDGARHVATGLMLGATRGPEGDGVPSENADGDGADEDGVAFGVIDFEASSTASVTVDVQGGSGRLDAWIDFNQDGDWGDRGERIFTSQAVGSGANDLTFVIPGSVIPGSFNRVPGSSVPGIAQARFRLSSSGGLPPSGPAPDGEVEDYAVTILDGIDFGDAPDTGVGIGAGNYQTLEADDGARHMLGGPRLGADVDSELDGLPSDRADGDDLDKDDDDDGVTFGEFVVGQLEPQQVAITVNVQGTDGKLDAWIDFNRDGDWLDVDEQIFAAQSVVVGDNEFTFDLPPELTAGDTYARFRISTDGGLAPTGLADSGEVEDYLIEIPPGIDFGDAPDLAGGTQAGDYETLLDDDGARHIIGTLRLGGAVDVEDDAFQSAMADGDDSTDDDDEDGVTFCSILQNQKVEGTVIVDVEGAAGKLDAWIDFNNDGDWSDPSEQVLTSEDVQVGSNKLTFQVPGLLNPGTTFARFRLSTAGGLTPTGLADDGEVEDYRIEILPIGRDYGDAPDDYPNSGAWHTIGDLRLGCSVDAEFRPLTSNDAFGDGPDDDGVFATASIVAFDAGSTTASFSVTASNEAVATGIGKVDAWIDFNQDLDWDDPGEQIYDTEDVGPGVNVLPFTVPAGATPGETYARFRISKLGGLTPEGTSSTGEVEDYIVTILDGDVEGGAAVEVMAPDPGTIEIIEGSVIIRTRNPDRIIFTAPGGTVASINITGTAGDDTLNVEDVPGLIVTGDAGVGHDTLNLLGGSFSLDLTAIPDSAIQGIEAINITGSGDNSLTLDVNEVLNISPTSDTLRVQHDVGDSVSYGEGWAVGIPQIVDRQYLHVLTQVSATVQVVNTTPFHNPLRALDTNRDGSVSPLDALIIVNRLNSSGPGPLSTPLTVDGLTQFFYVDTNADLSVAPIDVIRVVNFLNGSTGGTEGEGTVFGATQFAIETPLRRAASSRFPIASMNLSPDHLIDANGIAVPRWASAVAPARIAATRTERLDYDFATALDELLGRDEAGLFDEFFE
ncbi:MAG: hypothetical protein H8E66_28285 [Planctomycetes bacterium]|nr:hypothetical protein [Planctomycetota bacterium]